MTELEPKVWDDLEALASRTGLPVERVGLTRRRCAAPGDRPGSPYVLLAGRPDAGLELLLARWLAPEVAERMLEVGDHPLVIGPTPAQVQPRLGTWPSYPLPSHGPGHLLGLRVAQKPPADVVAQLGLLGYLDQLVLVTRLCQPLHQQERNLARTLAALAATARVLIVAVPGEEPAESDLAEVTAYAVNQLRQVGFCGRCLGAGIWFTGAEYRPGTIPDIGAFLAVKADEVAAGRRGMCRQAVLELIEELRRKAISVAAPPPINVSDSESDRLIRELGGFLTDLGRELNRLAEKRRPWSAELLRSYALDAIRGWGSYLGVEGIWLKFVERLRPGTQAAFIKEGKEAFALLDYEPGNEPAEEPKAVAAVQDRIVTEAKRLGVGLAMGVGAYLVVAALLGNAPGPVGLPGLVVTLLCYGALAVGTILGYGTGRSLFRTLQGARAGSLTPRPPAIHGWVQVERRLTAWVSERLRAHPASPAEELQEMVNRLGLEESNV